MKETSTPKPRVLVIRPAQQNDGLELTRLRKPVRRSRFRVFFRSSAGVEGTLDTCAAEKARLTRRIVAANRVAARIGPPRLGRT
jgi:hypothetical protein